tara:strand:+ start:596 stop:802 length:207 start_codon:yes stop_codon:yes gene_type:complete
MSVILRHRQYPLVIIYKDPKESWDGSMAKIVKGDIVENDFERFTEISTEQLAQYLHDLGPNPKEKSEE